MMQQRSVATPAPETRLAGQGSFGLGPVVSWSPTHYDGATGQYSCGTSLIAAYLSHPAVRHNAQDDSTFMPRSASLPIANARLAQIRQQRACATSNSKPLSPSAQGEMDTTPGQQILYRKAASAPPGPSHGVQNPGSRPTSRIPQAVHTGNSKSPPAPAYEQTIGYLEETLDLISPLADADETLRHEVEEIRTIVSRVAQRTAKLAERSRKLHQLRLAVEQVLFAPVAVDSNVLSGTEVQPTRGESAGNPTANGEDDCIEVVREVEEITSAQLLYASSDLSTTIEGREGGRYVISTLPNDGLLTFSANSTKIVEARKRPVGDVALEESSRKRARGVR
ncbi:hypothetical protein ONZ51_g7322 [Trametes cubensis]|uniref:Uncharacterized protein n=1 Tax=Trametes cubensis TaxID=1111947 RepID=A0AAD7TQC9_9APHY|nr:hypothetical protein ONZ51_g7322 [Trametes cubensis]